MVSRGIKKLLYTKQIESTAMDKIKALVGFHRDKKVPMSKLKKGKEE